MDIVEFWNRQVNKWNEEQKCGLCWNFGAPLTEDQLNVQQSDNDNKCCVHVFLTDLSFNESISYNSKTGFVNGKSCEWSFTLWVLKHGLLGVNNYNEINGYPIDKSNWVATHKPLYECIGCDLILDNCELLGFPINIKKWQGTTVINYADDNYNGWKIQATFKV